MAEASDTVTLALDAGVATITLNRPEQLNALTPDMLLEIPRALNRAVDAGARAILITGAGRAFCAGAALGGGATPGVTDLGETIATYYNPLAEALSASPVPLVSAVNGPAAGAGASIALAADVIVAAESAYLLLAFANIGLVPDAGATWLVAKSAGRVKAMEMALLGERMSAEEAHRYGLVTRVAADAELMTVATALARKLAEMPTQALGLIRRQIRDALDLSFQDALALEGENQRRAGFTDDYVEAVEAFKAKRRPVFKGH